MWKKSEDEKIGVDASTSPAPKRAAGVEEPSMVGRGIIIKGDVTGNQDLLIQGQLDGTVTLPDNEVVVGRDGRVNATIEARNIIIEGTVEGDLRGIEQIVVKSSGDVSGNISAPRVGLEDGALFKGSIDMEPKSHPQPKLQPLPDDESDAPVKDDEKQQAIPGTGSA
ncbi:MAG: polymer-forming cytoskeletal protein [Gammaproteobacteria bacterium]|nr:MAG: polymer-forming cytoskeletal protein [Gammaproteobacteria bacterium]